MDLPVLQIKPGLYDIAPTPEEVEKGLDPKQVSEFTTDLLINNYTGK